MSNRNIGVPVLAGYLLLFWGGVAGLTAYATSNAVPTAPVIEWKDAEVNTSSKLAVVIAEPGVDPDGDEVTYSYVWKKNGEVQEHLTNKTVANADTLKGENWEVTVIPDDGSSTASGCSMPWRQCVDGSVSTTISISIGNAEPRARVSFLDENGEPYDEHSAREDLMATTSCSDADVRDQKRLEKEAAEQGGVAEAKPAEAEAATDAEVEKPEEADPCTYTIRWYDTEAVGDAEITEETEFLAEGPVLERKLLKRDTQVTVWVVANDGEDDSKPITEEMYIVR